jgi:hypothetical protein
VELALHGEYNGLHSEKRLKDGLELRGAAVTVFEVIGDPGEYLKMLTIICRTLFVMRKLN